MLFIKRDIISSSFPLYNKCFLGYFSRTFNSYKNFNVELFFINGKPGTGKNTLCKHAINSWKYQDNYPLYHISIGDLLRLEVNNKSINNSCAYEDGSYLKDTISNYISQGKILPSYITAGLLHDNIINIRNSCIYTKNKNITKLLVLVDGFPRHLDNLSTFKRIQSDFIHFNNLITLDCSTTIIQQRLLSRNRFDDTNDIIDKRLKKWNDNEIYSKLQDYFKKYYKSTILNTSNGSTSVYTELENILLLSLKQKNALITSTKSQSDSNLWINKQLKSKQMPSYVYSYPIKKAYKPISNSITIDNILKETWYNYKGPLNLYIHIPFCKMKCSFCNLFTTMNFKEDKTDIRYFKALKSELGYYFNYLSKDITIDTVHIGGGTPSIINLSFYKDFINYLQSNTNLNTVKEIAIEATPGSLYKNNTIQELASIGITRLSIGVQSFDKDELISVNRDHEYGYSEYVIKEAVQSDITNINIDLIFGMPHQSKQVFLNNIKTAISLKIDTITLYCLAVREKTKYGRILKQSLKNTSSHSTNTSNTSNTEKISNFFTNEELFDWYECGVKLLKDHGYNQKTLVLFGKGNMQEEREFAGIPTLGLGAGARSYHTKYHYSSDNYYKPQLPHKIIETYYDNIENKKQPSILSYVSLSKEEQMRKFIIMQLLYYKGIDLHLFRSKFHVLLEDVFKNQLSILSQNNLIEYIRYYNRDFIQLKENLKYSSGIAQLFFSDIAINNDSLYK